MSSCTKLISYINVCQSTVVQPLVPIGGVYQVVGGLKFPPPAHVSVQGRLVSHAQSKVNGSLKRKDNLFPTVTLSKFKELLILLDGDDSTQENIRTYLIDILALVPFSLWVADHVQDEILKLELALYHVGRGQVVALVRIVILRAAVTKRVNNENDQI